MLVNFCDVGAADITTEDCLKCYETNPYYQILLEEFSNDFYNGLAKVFKNLGNENLANIADCWIERLKEVNFVEISLKQRLLAATKNISKRKRENAIKALDNELVKKMDLAVRLCAPDDDLGLLFDSLFYDSTNEASWENKTAQKQYCARKFLIDNNLTDPTTSKVDLHANVDECDCEAINKAYIDEVEDKFIDEFEEDVDYPSSRKSKRCLAQSIRSNNFIAVSVKVIILREMGISDEVKAEEKSIFVEKLRVLYEEILSCN